MIQTVADESSGCRSDQRATRNAISPAPPIPARLPLLRSQDPRVVVGVQLDERHGDAEVGERGAGSGLWAGEVAVRGLVDDGEHEGGGAEPAASEDAL